MMLETFVYFLIVVGGIMYVGGFCIIIYNISTLILSMQEELEDLKKKKQ